MHTPGSIELITLTIEKNFSLSQNLSIGDAHFGQNAVRSGKKANACHSQHWSQWIKL